ncbi:hypothetical protein BS17DRAFT_769471 [Gyrodon lividus]|nr:hypothetical protein BS17DRAFT_769471 [Gyrodon lividus]
MTPVQLEPTDQGQVLLQGQGLRKQGGLRAHQQKRLSSTDIAGSYLCAGHMGLAWAQSSDALLATSVKVLVLEMNESAVSLNPAYNSPFVSDFMQNDDYDSPVNRFLQLLPLKPTSVGTFSRGSSKEEEVGQCRGAGEENGRKKSHKMTYASQHTPKHDSGDPGTLH